MSDQAELRTLWRRRWLSSIQEFADLATQRRRWLDPGEPSPHYSFVEYICCYFDDLHLTSDDGGYGSAVADGYVTGREAATVAEFHALADAYEPPKGEEFEGERVLEDPNWLRVVEAARIAQAALLPLLTDAEERKLLLEP